MCGRRAVTFIELLIVVGLFGVLFAVMLGLLFNSDSFFTRGQNKIAGQYEARRIIDILSRDLRASSPDWIVNGTHYAAAVSDNYTRLDYYVPEFNSDNSLSGLKKITYKRDPADAGKLLMKSGNSTETTVSADFEYVRLGCGCSGCASFNCTAPASDCPVVQIEVGTDKGNRFDLTARIALRNVNLTVPGEIEVEAPEEGEF